MERERGRWNEIGGWFAFCRWMGQGSTRTVVGNTGCCERPAEWQAVSPPPYCQSPVWLLSICHSLAQPTHSDNPSPGLFSPSLLPLFFNPSFSWLMFKLVGPVTTHLPAKIFFRLVPHPISNHIHPRCPAKYSFPSLLYLNYPTLDIPIYIYIHIRERGVLKNLDSYIVTNGRFKLGVNPFSILELYVYRRRRIYI